MGVYGLSGFRCAGDVTSRARAYVHDTQIAGGSAFPDSRPVTFELLNSAYETAQILMTDFEMETFTAETILSAIPPVVQQDPSIQVYINRTGTNNGTQSFSPTSNPPGPILPVNMVGPLMLWERQTPASGNTGSRIFQPMRRTRVALPSAFQGVFFRYWEWRGNALWVIGSQQTMDIRLRFNQQFQSLVTPGDLLGYPGNVFMNLVASFTAAEMYGEQGNTEGQASMQQKAQAVLDSMVNVRVHERQAEPVRFAPYDCPDGLGFMEITGRLY